MGADADHVRRGGGPGRLGARPPRRGGGRLALRVRARCRGAGRVGPTGPPRAQCTHRGAPGRPHAAGPGRARRCPHADRRGRPRPAARAAGGPRGADLLRLPGQLRGPRQYARRADRAAARGARGPRGRRVRPARARRGYRSAERRGRYDPAAHGDDQRALRPGHAVLCRGRRPRLPERRRRHPPVRGDQHALGAEGPASAAHRCAPAGVVVPRRHANAARSGCRSQLAVEQVPLVHDLQPGPARRGPHRGHALLARGARARHRRP